MGYEVCFLFLFYNLILLLTNVLNDSGMMLEIYPCRLNLLELRRECMRHILLSYTSPRHILQTNASNDLLSSSWVIGTTNTDVCKCR